MRGRQRSDIDFAVSAQLAGKVARSETQYVVRDGYAVFIVVHCLVPDAVIQEARPICTWLK